jgi:hypothetical protein
LVHIIVRRAHNGAYVLKDLTGDILDRHVPIDQIKVVSKTARLNDKNIHYINKILKHRGAPGSYEYLVDWYGFSSDEQSWEPQSSFLDDAIITRYWASLNNQ